jgi:hypothetical protein
MKLRRPPDARLALLAALALIFTGCGQATKPAAAPIAVEAAPAVEASGAQAAHDLAEPLTEQMGYTPPTEAERHAFLKTLAKPTFTEAAPHFFAAGGPAPPSTGPPEPNKPVLLYRSLNLAHVRKYGKPFIVGAQGIGDCTSWGWGHAADVGLAIDYVLGTSGDFHTVATEAVYGLGRVEGSGRSRGGYSDGSYGAAMAAGVTKYGVVFRIDYTGQASAETDLRVYSKDRAKAWGNFGCGGQNDDGRLDAQARRHPVKQVALVTTYAEAVEAVRNGFAIAVCSGQGFTKQRDAAGFARASGSWAHCMVFLGVRFDRPGLLCLNSWGPRWISGPKWPEDQPDGSFWVDEAVVERMLRGRDSYAVSTIVGFPARKLAHAEGW